MALPHVAETVNWGHHLVYWMGDRDIGGKMFALTDLEMSGQGVLTVHVCEERFHELIECEGIHASPHLARAYWVTLERWDALRPREIEELLAAAHGLIYEKLPKKTKTILAMPDAERKKLIRERKAVVAEKAKSEGKPKRVFGAKGSTSKGKIATSKGKATSKKK
jgi:predicted DNA-binding protein (MmcQ/YjbR family)